MRRGRGGEIGGHETQFHERPETTLEQPIVNLIGIRPVVNGPALRIFVVNAGLIVQDGMEANVANARYALNGAEIPAITIAQRQNRAARTKNLLPKMWKRPCRRVRIYPNHFRRRLAGKRIRQQNAGRKYFVGQVDNLPPIVNRPSAAASAHSLMSLLTATAVTT